MSVLSHDRYQWVPQNQWDLVGRPPSPAHRTVAIVVTYFEQPDSLARMYAAIASAPLDPRCHELVVVDDGSRIPPMPPAGGFPLVTRMLRQDDLGCRPGAARNLGAASTDAEVLVFFDADTLPEPGTVGLLAAWPAAIPDALVVGRRGHVDLAGWNPSATEAWLSGQASPPPRGDDPVWLADGYRQTRNLLDVDDRSYRYVISAVMACHRSLYDDIGGFDGDRSDYGSDDWEFAFRAFNNGAVLIHEPDAVGWHDEPDWAGRNGDLTAKNTQTVYLARAVGEPLTRGPGLLHHYPDTIARVEARPDATDGQIITTVHALLSGLPDINVHLACTLRDSIRRHVSNDPRVRFVPPTAAALERCRTIIDLDGPAYWEPAPLRSTVDDVRPPGPGLITIDCDGSRLASVASTRALGRVRRATRQGVDEATAMTELFGVQDRSALTAGVHRLTQEVDLAGFFAGWAKP